MDFALIKTDDIEALKNELKALHNTTSHEWLDNEEAIKFLKISKRTMFRYRRSGKLAFSINGRKIYFKKSDLSELLENYYKNSG